MGYRFLVVLLAIFMIGGCSAFDSDADPYVGFDPDIVPAIPGGKAGIHNGFYNGTLTLDTNSCSSISEEVGTVTDFSVDVLHIDNYLNLTFEDGTVAAGELLGDGAIFMVKEGTREDVYYLTFSDEEETVSGTLEVIEPDEEGQYGDPCATYSVTMEEGERPENFGAGEVGGEDDEGEDSDDADADEGEDSDDADADADDGEGEGDGEIDVPWEMPDEMPSAS